MGKSKEKTRIEKSKRMELEIKKASDNFVWKPQPFFLKVFVVLFIFRRLIMGCTSELLKRF